MAIQEMVYTLATKAISQESGDKTVRATRMIYEYDASNESELRTAIYNSFTDGEVSIRLTSSFKITQAITVDGNRTISIHGSNGSSKRVIGTDKELTHLFSVKEGSSVSFLGTILKGGTSSATDVSYRTTNAVVVADGGSVQFNNCNVLYSQGALLDINSNGSATAYNTIFSNAKGTTNGICNCGGAVRINSGTFSMSGYSEITNNAYGGVYVSERGTFNMNGGNIYGNKVGAGHTLTSAGYLNYGMGGGVFCNGTFNYSSGRISGNSASNGGSGIGISSTGQMQVESGANLVNSGSESNELWLYTSNVTFKSAPSVPMNTKIKYDATFRTIIAKCSQDVSAKSCLGIDGIMLCNDPRNSGAIIVSKNFTVTFEPNGATGKQVVTTQKEYNSTIQLPSDYQKTGYTLTGWEDSNTRIVCKPGSTQTVVADTTYTAEFDEKAVKVHFNLNNTKASNVCTENNVNLKYSGTLSLSSYTPKATGYKFEGWYTDKALTGSKVTSVSPAKLGKDTTIELYAKWSTTASNSSSSSTNTGSVTTINQPTKAPSSAPSSSGWLSINVTKLTMVIGEKYEIIASSDTDHVTMRSNSNCVTVNNNGLVRAKKAGTAIITVTSGTNTKKCRVKVKAAPKASDIKVKAKKVKVGKTVSVQPVFVHNTDCMYVSYSSANKKVATVSSSGKVKGLKKGTAKITIKCSTGAKKVVKIKVV